MQMVEIICDTIHRAISFKLAEDKARTSQLKILMGLKLLIHHDYKVDAVIDCLRDTSGIFERSNTTRWNSVYNMLNSYVSNSDSISIVLIEQKKQHLRLTVIEEQMVKDLTVILKIFEGPSKTLQGQGCRTLHMVSFCNLTMRVA